MPCTKEGVCFIKNITVIRHHLLCLAPIGFLNLTVMFVYFLCLRPKKIDEKKCALPLHDFYLKLAVSR